MSISTRAPLSSAEFVAWLSSEGEKRYHDHHPFHLRMHEGKLTREELQSWVQNRYYYQSRVPIKDAIILSKSEDPAFRRMWIQRIHDHDGDREGEGGLALWLRLAEGVGLDPGEVARFAQVRPGVRFACDAYVQLVQKATLVEAVASSLTESFAPDLMSRRIAAWETHYPWVKSEVLEYFRTRVTKARRDSQQAIDFVCKGATTYDLQEKCVAALVKKTEILWHLLDCLLMPAPPAGLQEARALPATGGGRRPEHTETTP